MTKDGYKREVVVINWFFFVPKFEYKPLFCGEIVRIIRFSQKNIGYHLLYEHVSNKF